MYRGANREDLATKEEEEFKVLQFYLPQQLSDEEMEVLVKQVLDKGAADFGSIMKEVMARAQGKADGKRVSEVVKRLTTNDR